MDRDQTDLLRSQGVVFCPHCGLYIGHMVEVRVTLEGGETRVMTALAVGGAILFHGAGYCMYCKRPWFWESSKKRLLVRRAEAREVRPCSTPGM